MEKDIFENWMQFNQQMLEGFKSLGEAHLRLSEKLLREQTELTACMCETAICNMEELSKSKDYSEASTAQAAVIQELGQKVLESARTSADIIAEAGQVYTRIFEKGMQTASAGTSERASKASKSSRRKAG